MEPIILPKVLDRKTANHIQKRPFAPDLNRIGFGKFFGELFRLANPSPRQPEGLFVVQTALLESDNSIAQMRFQFASVVRREVRLRGQSDASFQWRRSDRNGFDFP